MGHVPELGLGAVVRGVAGRVERGGAELPTFVHCIELEIERRLAVWAQQSWLRELHHALQCLETRVGGLHPPAHEFNRQEAAAYLDVRFAAPGRPGGADVVVGVLAGPDDRAVARSEEHTSELQSPCNLVCRLLLEKKKKMKIKHNPTERSILF